MQTRFCGFASVHCRHLPRHITCPCSPLFSIVLWKWTAKKKICTKQRDQLMLCTKPARSFVGVYIHKHEIADADEMSKRSIVFAFFFSLFFFFFFFCLRLFNECTYTLTQTIIRKLSSLFSFYNNLHESTYVLTIFVFCSFFWFSLVLVTVRWPHQHIHCTRHTLLKRRFPLTFATLLPLLNHFAASTIHINAPIHGGGGTATHRICTRSQHVCVVHAWYDRANVHRHRPYLDYYY